MTEQDPTGRRKKLRRFQTIQGVRQYLARVLVELEAAAATADAATKARLATARIAGARLAAELITSTALERRIKTLEASEARELVGQISGKHPFPGTKGPLAHSKDGGRNYILAAELDRYLESLEQAPGK